MAARRSFAPRKSLRDIKLENNKADRFLALMAGKEPMAQSQVAPKRAYTKRVKQVGELSELQEQIRVIKWWDKHCAEFSLPPYALFSIPNGSHLTGAIAGHNLKRSGMRAGAEDLFLAVAKLTQHGLFIEMKIKSGSVEEDQDAMHAFHLRGGYRVMVAWSHEEAIEQIQDYLIAF